MKGSSGCPVLYANTIPFTAFVQVPGEALRIDAAVFGRLLTEGTGACRAPLPLQPRPCSTNSPSMWCVIASTDRAAVCSLAVADA